MFLIKSTVLKELLNDPEWAEQIDHIKTSEELLELVTAYMKGKGYRIVTIKNE